MPSGRLNRLWAISGVASRIAARGLASRTRNAFRTGEDPPAWLSVDNARILADRLSHLRGAAMKLGQMLSMHGDQLLPKEFADALAKLRSQADIMPEGQVRQVMEAAYGPDWRRRFRDLQVEPLAAASIGQVHRAIADDGRQLALKLQYPGVVESIDSDVENLAGIVSLGRLLPHNLDLRDVIDALKRQLHAEADYEREAGNALAYAQKLSTDPGLRVPAVHLDLTTSRTLAMDYADGPNLFEWADRSDQATRNDLAQTLIALTLRELLVYRLCQTDPNPGNYLWDPRTRQIVLLDFGATRPVPAAVTASYARLLRAAMDGDADAMRAALIDAGALDPGLSTEAQAFYVEVGLSATAMLHQGGLHRFGANDALQRLRAWTKQGLKHGLPLRAPPAELTFFQRKLGGTYLMCRRLRAQVDCRALCEQVLDEAEAEPATGMAGHG